MCMPENNIYLIATNTVLHLILPNLKIPENISREIKCQ